MKPRYYPILFCLFMAASASMSSTASTEDTAADLSAPRRQKLIDAMASVQPRVEALGVFQGGGRSQACKTVILPLKDAVYTVYALALFYPPLHTSVEVPGLHDFMEVETQMATQATVLGDYCTNSRSEALKGVPSIQDVQNAAGAILQFNQRLSAIVTEDMAPQKSKE
ncbi:hypothetical protein WDW37_00675 [Bdellovibrionota bacterium FG-1]